MTLSRKTPLPGSGTVLSAPPARFKSGRRAPGVVGRSSRSRFLGNTVGNVLGNWGRNAGSITSPSRLTNTRPSSSTTMRKAP